MKKTCVFIAVFAVLIIGLVGCNKENSKNETPAIVDVAENVTGTFEGYTMAQSDYFSDYLTEEGRYLPSRETTLMLSMSRRAFSSY